MLLLQVLLGQQLLLSTSLGRLGLVGGVLLPGRDISRGYGMATASAAV